MIESPPAPSPLALNPDRCGISEAAALLGVSRVTIWRWIRAGRLPVERLGHRTVRIQRADLEQLLLKDLAGSRLWVGRRLATERLGTEMAVETRSSDTHAPSVDWREMGASDHFVQFYEAETFLLDAVADFVGDGLRAGDNAIVVATAAHRHGLADRLRAVGLDLDATAAAGEYVALDAAGTLAAFMAGEMPDRERFQEVIGGVVRRAAQGGRHVRAFGEMVALLVDAGNPAAAIQLEQLWNELQRSQPFSLFCAYPMEQLGDESRGATLADVCAAHSRVIPTESYTALATADERLRAIAVLQEKAQRLEAEIAERKQAEAALREQARTIETINRVGQALVTELDQDQLVQAITDAATAVTGAEFGAFFYNAIDERGESYILYSLSGAPGEGFDCFPMPRNTGLFEATFRGHGVVRLADVTQDPRYGQNPPYFGLPPSHPPVRSYLSAPVVSRSGEVLGGLCFGHSRPGIFTERAEHLLVGIAGQAAIALDNARLYRSAQEAVRLRDEFLAAASHDLKTPLAAVKGVAQLLERRARRAGTPETSALVDGLRRIDAAANRMASLVETLLDVTRLQMGQPLPLDRQPADVIALARQVVEEQQQTTTCHQLRLESELPALIGAWDAARLERMLGNLVNNAVKYSPAGGDVVVTIGDEGGAEGRWAVIAVRDQGIGIAASDLPNVFERFQRGRNVQGVIPGTGIGLAAVQQVVERHGGRVAVESQEGRGTTFTVRLPLTPREVDGAPANPLFKAASGKPALHA